MKGFYEGGWLDCFKCPSYNEIFWSSIGKVAWLTIVIYFLAYLTSKNACGYQFFVCTFINSFKLIENHNVMLNAINSIRFNWSTLAD